MKQLIKMVFISILFSQFLYADNGDKKIKLIGDLKKDTPKYITPKYIDNNFETIGVVLYNPWEKRKDKYSGVLLNEFIKKLSNDDTKELVSKAIDDYKVVFTQELWNKKRILLVNKVNDKYISLREKGPLRVVFFRL